jgi:Flp pilus assembly protein TadD
MKRTALLLPVLALLTLLIGRAGAQGDATPSRIVGGTAIDTFGLGSDNPNELALFAPLPPADYPSDFRFEIETFKHITSPYVRFLRPPDGSEDLNPNAVYRQLFGLSIQETDWNVMLERAEKLLENHPDEVKNIRGLATLYAMTGNYERAVRNFARYLDKRPNDLAFLSGFAHTLFCLARFEDSRSALRRAFEINPNYLPAMYTHSCLLVATNGPVARVASYWRGANIGDKEKLAAWLYADRSPLKQVLGVEGYTRICNLVVGEGSYVNLVLIPDSLAEARNAFVRQNWRKAQVYYELATGYGVDGIAVYQQLARCLYENGKRVESLKKMYQLSVQYPDSSEVWYNLGYILINSEAPAEAVKAFREAVRLSPAIGEYRFALACALAGNRQSDEAFKMLPELKKKHSKDFPLWMEGDNYYLKAIREDPRYSALP